MMIVQGPAAIEALSWVRLICRVERRNCEKELVREALTALNQDTEPDAPIRSLMLWEGSLL